MKFVMEMGRAPRRNYASPNPRVKMMMLLALRQHCDFQSLITYVCSWMTACVHSRQQRIFVLECSCLDGDTACPGRITKHFE
jgi:hypothetical protein